MCFLENSVLAEKVDPRIHYNTIRQSWFHEIKNIYIETSKIKHSTYKNIVQKWEGCCFDAMIIIILMSINYSIIMSYSFEIKHLSCNFC